MKKLDYLHIYIVLFSRLSHNWFPNRNMKLEILSVLASVVLTKVSFNNVSLRLCLIINFPCQLRLMDTLPPIDLHRNSAFVSKNLEEFRATSCFDIASDLFTNQTLEKYFELE